jgi:hypothetical protein
MSRHHRAQKWTTHSPKLRAKWTALLPRPCIQCGQPVMKGEPWHVGHIRAAEDGGRPTMQNTAPVHARCNLSDGGKRGAARVNAARRAVAAREQAEAGRRSWR